MGNVETRNAMSDSVANLTDDQERKIAAVEKKIRTSSYGAPPESWIVANNARPAPASAVRFKNSGNIMRVGHRFQRPCVTIEGQWLVIQSLWMIPRWGVVPWVCYPLKRTKRFSYLAGGAFVDAEFDPEES